MKYDLNQIILADCMNVMADIPDKYFELAIVDPPYGIGDRLCNGAGKHKNSRMRVQYENGTRWDAAPEPNFFNMLFRISINQIIWGGNYFQLPATRGIIAWDKRQMMPTFSRWEYAWSSFDCPSRLYEQRTIDEPGSRIHPTQKPVSLYRWLLQNYAKPGDKIIDTHSGSGSCSIACHIEKHDFLAIEKDPDYHAASVKRLEETMAQGVLF